MSRTSIDAGRIATGRDAADTAFLDNHKGSITLNSSTVTAVATDGLPKDDIHELVSSPDPAHASVASCVVGLL